MSTSSSDVEDRVWIRKYAGCAPEVENLVSNNSSVEEREYWTAGEKLTIPIVTPKEEESRLR